MVAGVERFGLDGTVDHWRAVCDEIHDDVMEKGYDAERGLHPGVWLRRARRLRAGQLPTNSPYCAIKGGVRMLMRTIAVELAPHSITVNNIAPEAPSRLPSTRTSTNIPSRGKSCSLRFPLVGSGGPRTSLPWPSTWLRDASSYSTGNTFFVDGGMMRQAGSL
jgi:NAD(P)-dependent dehydrogenase (short-subunit alcohol dehydrogenase family)